MHFCHRPYYCILYGNALLSLLCCPKQVLIPFFPSKQLKVNRNYVVVLPQKIYYYYNELTIKSYGGTHTYDHCNVKLVTDCMGNFIALSIKALDKCAVGCSASFSCASSILPQRATIESGEQGRKQLINRQKNGTHQHVDGGGTV